MLYHWGKYDEDFSLSRKENISHEIIFFCICCFFKSLWTFKNQRNKTWMRKQKLEGQYEVGVCHSEDTAHDAYALINVPEFEFWLCSWFQLPGSACPCRQLVMAQGLEPTLPIWETQKGF